MRLDGLKVWICALGCRSNIYEGEALAGELAARGAEVADKPEGCGAAVIVSCSVTAAADKKCRQAVRRARRELDSRADKKGPLSVCGCWAQALDAAEARALGVDILVGNRLKSRLPDLMEAWLMKAKLMKAGPAEAELTKAKLTEAGSSPLSFDQDFIDARRDIAGDRIWDALWLSGPVLRTRAFVKVQEGCDHFCSYCVIPFLRGRSTSRPIGEALAEIGRIAEAGCREVVLTGINLGTYRDGEASLADLIRKVSAVPGLARLRLGSLEPFALGLEPGGLLDALAESPVFCRHLHLPLQSGDDGILARMRRGHSADDFLRVCDEARRRLGGDLHISTDVLAAFPGEDEAAHRRTLDVMRRAGLGRVHVFPYSPRRGTEAEKFPGRVPPRAASARVKEIAALGDELLARYASRFNGRVLPVLAEDVREGGFPGCFGYSGYTRNFLAARVQTDERAEAGMEYDVRVTDCVNGTLSAVNERNAQSPRGGGL